MFCTKCGLKNDDDAIFCAGCGNKLKMPENAVNKSDITENVAEDIPVSPSDSSSVENSDYKVQLDKVLEETSETEATSSSIIEVEPQPSNFSNMTQQGSNGYTYNNQSMNNNQNVSNNQSMYKNKFSVKRFIFSALVIIASIVSCVGIAFKYLDISLKGEAYGSTATFNASFKGTEIIKNDDFYIDLEDMDIYTSDDDIVESQRTIRILLIISAVAMIVFAVLELVLLTAVRRKWAYALSILFSMIQLIISGVIAYEWCFEFLDEFKEIYRESMYFSSSYADISLKITAGIGAGIIIVLVSQAVIFVSSIILMTCKNRPKIKVMEER